MKTLFRPPVLLSNTSPANLFRRGAVSFSGVAVVLAFTLLLSACGTPGPAPATGSADEPGKRSEVYTISEGDVLKIAFPGAPTLDTTQTVRRDGKITLAVIGEVPVAGLTPTGLEKVLAERYADQLVSKEVSVTVVSTSFFVYVTGAVLRPGKIGSDRPISALEAIMEAGGFDQAKADTSAVRIIRQEDGRTKNYTVNLKTLLEGKTTELFYLKPSDIVIVPEKFAWF